MWKKYWFCLEGLVVFIVRLYRRKSEVWFYRNCKVMRLLGQTVEGLRSLRFIQLDEDVPSLILGINKVVNTQQLTTAYHAENSIICRWRNLSFFFLLFPNWLGKKKLWKGGEKREKARKPPKVITVWHVKGNSLRYWLLRLSHLRVQSE